MRFTDTRVVVTGGASGIGEATAARFKSEGAKVFIIDRDERAATTLANAQDYGFFKADVSNFEEVTRAFEIIDQQLGGIDVLINNAGVSVPSTLLETTPDAWRTMMGVNLDGVFYVAIEAARRMKATRSGVILNMGSVSGLVGFPSYGAYCTSKAGVIELSRCLALELAPDVRVNAVCPGYVLTPMQRKEYTTTMLAECENKIPLRRLAAPEEIAGLFAYLASAEAAFITGQAIVADGGEVAGGLASR